MSAFSQYLSYCCQPILWILDSRGPVPDSPTCRAFFPSRSIWKGIVQSPRAPFACILRRGGCRPESPQKEDGKIASTRFHAVHHWPSVKRSIDASTHSPGAVGIPNSSTTADTFILAIRPISDSLPFRPAVNRTQGKVTTILQKNTPIQPLAAVSLPRRLTSGDKTRRRLSAFIPILPAFLDAAMPIPLPVGLSLHC